jgi:hypothetical protein
LLAALSAGLVGGPQALAQTARDLIQDYLAPLEQAQKSAFYAQCRYDGVKVVIILPLGEAKGRMVELSWGGDANKANPMITNDAAFTVSSKVELEDLMMGGPGGYLSIQK